MGTQYHCGSERRRELVRSAVGADGLPVLNGIDYLEVAVADQTTLELVFIHPLPGEVGGVPGAPSPPLTADNLIVEGGVRGVGVQVLAVAAAGSVLTVTVDRAGDFSTYRVRLVALPGSDAPPAGFDPLLSGVAFSFKAACPSDFDCAPVEECPPEPLVEPSIDYLAKDYASFRRLMLDRLAVNLPGWSERSPADLGIALVEVLAYAADHLSYEQDAVATEAYLGTARRRVSVRRHAKLLDYAMHDGASARAWVVLTVDPAADGVVLPGPRTIEGGAPLDASGTLFLTRAGALPAVIDDSGAEEALRAGAQPFEALHDLTLRTACNEMRFYTWGDEDCCLPRGATRAYLRNDGDALAALAPGRVLVFEEVRGAESGRPEDADPALRHAVRLTGVAFTEDPLLPEVEGEPPGAQRLRVVEIGWDAGDALPFPLCLREVADPRDAQERVPVSVARGNVVLVDHGVTQAPEVLEAVPESGRYRPRLARAPVAREGRVAAMGGATVPFDPAAPAAAASAFGPRDAAPAVRLRESGTGRLWLPAADLLASDAFDREFVVESDEDGTVSLRFGDGVHGRAPLYGAPLDAVYRMGGGLAGNVGAEAIAHVVSAEPGILAVRNPLPGGGGTDPEPIAQVRLYAPQAFRTQERAVTEADYAAAAERHPSVQRAAATFRWTGSWHTVFVTVDRKGGQPVDAAFQAELAAFLERFSLAGYDLEIEPPRFVPLDLAFTVCVAPGHLRAEVEAALFDAFSNRDSPDGGRGFFHPDNFTFGQPVYLSRIVAAAMAVPGVAFVDTEVSAAKPNRFQRWGEPSRGEWLAGEIGLARLEIARLDNDPSLPENGRLVLFMEGGR